jgi:hypothetical protein
MKNKTKWIVGGVALALLVVVTVVLATPNLQQGMLRRAPRMSVTQQAKFAPSTGFVPSTNFVDSRLVRSQINRAEFVTVLVNNSKLPVSQPCNVFSDVDPASWYAPSVCTLYEQGILQGYHDGTFKPANKINRAEASKLIFDTFGVVGNASYDKTPYFSDIRPQRSEPWYYNTVNQLGWRGVFADEIKKGEAFRPNSFLTRKEAEKWMNNVAKLLSSN